MNDTKTKYHGNLLLTYFSEQQPIALIQHNALCS